ncbi:hypothetical protein LTR27_001462 [Elasticomyces elasticus]|nr:hypothetical protein LTR27_001462 [Elasticomyces elasticus]
MAKRKRDEDADGTPEPANGAKVQRVRHKLQHGTVKLGHAFKVAKGFERQKLSRRRKNAAKESNAKDVQRIDAEAAAVKTLDTSLCARVYLYKLLTKIKAVAESQSLPPEVRKVPTLSTDTAVLNVHARLCNSNPVKEALPAVLKDIEQALGVKIAKENVPNKKRVRAKDHEADEGQQKEKRQARVKDVSDSGGEEEVSLPDDDASDVGLSRFDGRLAPSDDEDDIDDEDLDVETIERRLQAEGIAQKGSKALSRKYDPAADLEVSDDDDEMASPSPEPRKAPALKKSSFVPSLSMGGYISGSGSDVEDIDEKPRKNRRGQRARQQIWEKKYGAKAQHLQNQTGSQSRDQGWDPKRGATDASERRGKEKPSDRSVREEPRKPRDLAAKQSTAEVKVKHRDDEGSLHPSWMAAKIAKEKKAAAPIAFQGKKITFD